MSEFLQNESYIRQYPAPLAIYPLRTALGAGIHFLLGLAVVLVFVWGTGGFGNLPALVSLALSLVLLFLFGWSLAVCVGVINVMFQDTQHLTEVALQILFYVTPIIYRPDQLSPELAQIVRLNPLACFFDLVRQPILEGCIPSAHAYAVACVATLVAVAAATAILARFERRFIFYF